MFGLFLYFEGKGGPKHKEFMGSGVPWRRGGGLGGGFLAKVFMFMPFLRGLTKFQNTAKYRVLSSSRVLPNYFEKGPSNSNRSQCCNSGRICCSWPSTFAPVIRPNDGKCFPADPFQAKEITVKWTMAQAIPSAGLSCY